MTILFKNQQWKVEKCGMTAIKRGYFIERVRIEERRLSNPDLFSWPLQVATKVWVDLDAFCEAFEKAISIYEPEYDRGILQKTFEQARQRKAESIRFDQMADKMFPGRLMLSSCELGEIGEAVRRESGSISTS